MATSIMDIEMKYTSKAKHRYHLRTHQRTVHICDRFPRVQNSFTTATVCIFYRITEKIYDHHHLHCSELEHGQSEHSLCLKG